MNIYRLQIFIFTLIASFILLQFTVLMDFRGITTYAALTIFGVSQVLHMCTTFLITWLHSRGISPILIIRVSLVIRILTAIIMLIVPNNYIFILMFFLYRISTTANILFEGLLVSKTQKENISFGRVRMFGSMGFASGGLITAAIVSIFGSVHYLILLIVLLDILSFFINVKYPIREEVKSKKEQKNKISLSLSKEHLFFIFLCSLTVALADAFNIILNYQYINTFLLSENYAIFWGGIAILFSAFISEVPAMISTEGFIRKIGARKIMMIGFSLSVIRWIVALIAPNHIIFTSTYLFHGIIFSFIFLGMIANFKDVNKSGMGPKIVLIFTLIASSSLLILTQIFSYILAAFGVFYILASFAIIHLLIAIIFYIKFRRI